MFVVGAYLTEENTQCTPEAWIMGENEKIYVIDCHLR